MLALPYHGGNYRDIVAEINTPFDRHLKDRGYRVVVTENYPDPWPAVLWPLYPAAGGKDPAAMFLGCLFCRVAIARPELWICAPLPIYTNRPPEKSHPRRYMVWHNAPQKLPRIPSALA
jgi:hypothetical protein